MYQLMWRNHKIVNTKKPNFLLFCLSSLYPISVIGGNSNQGLLSSEMNVGGLKVGYEKQVDSINTEEDMELELEPSPSAIVEEPMTRSR